LQADADFQKYFLLFFTGITRNSSDIAREQIREIQNKKSELKQMAAMVDIALKSNPEDFGLLLHENWVLKRTLSQSISTEFIDDIYDRGIKAGALGGKLLGAGGGGFILFSAPPSQHSSIRNALKDFLHVPFKFENHGSKILYSEAL
jgi:D-glycero-alpha-D-manno-heptose-7-phosphate kinase